MCKTRDDLINKLHAMKNKLGNCLSVIREELETEIYDLCADHAELEDRLHK
jgi:tRNA A22 N-methylase